MNAPKDKAAQYDPLFQAAGQKYGVDPSILRAIAKVESNFNPKAVGPQTRSGRAQGMMQFVPAMQKAYGISDPFNPEQSVDAAGRMMRDLLKRYDGDVGKALEAYNGGPRLVGKSRQTAQYREKVLSFAGNVPRETQIAQVSNRSPSKTPSKTDKMFQQATPPARVGGQRVSLSALSALPMGYKAALAMQYLADVDPDGNPEEQAQKALAELESMEELPVETGAQTPDSMSSMFAQAPEDTKTPLDVMQEVRARRFQNEKRRPMPSMNIVQAFAEGGEVSDLAEQMTVGTLPEDTKDYREVAQGVKQSLGDIRRGIQYAPADLIGAPVDIINMGLKPLGLGSETPFLGSDYLIQKGVEAGIYEPPSGTATETLSRLGTGILAPTLGAKTAGKGIAALEESLKGPPEGAIKPRGGIVDPGLISEVSSISIQRGEPMLLTAAKIAAEMKERDGFNRPITPEHRQVLTDFIDSKFSKYINTELGTEKDPVRQAILSGEAFPSSRLDMPLYDQAEAYRKALARETEDPDFVRISKDTADLMYDVGTNIKPSMLVTLDNLTDASQNILINRPQAVRELIRDISKGKRTEDPSLPADLNQLARTYADSIAKNAKLMTEEGNQNALQTLRADDNINFRLLSGQQFQGLNQTLQKAVNRDLVFDMSDPAYLGEFNPDRMIETLAAVPPDKLKNMSFTQAYQEGTRLLSSMRSYDKGVADVKAGKAVPKEFLFTYTEPVLDTPKGKWVKFTDPRVNEVEGKLMGHSVAGYNETKPYGLGLESTGREAFLSGDAEILSLRNEKGMPMVTLEYGRKHKSGAPKYVEQINGKFNSAPVEYLVDVLELMRKNNLQFSPNRKGASNINVHKNNRRGESLYYTDPETGKDVVAYDVVDWPALYKSYKENTGPFEVVKISKPVETKNQIDRTVFYTTPERLNLLNSEQGPGGFIKLGSFRPLEDRAR